MSVWNRSSSRARLEAIAGFLRLGRCKAEAGSRGARCRLVWEWDRDPGDAEILAIAHREGRILVTLDKDFGELAIVRGIPHAGILRLVGFGARQQAVACLKVLSLHGNELAVGAIITAEPGRLRIRIERS